MDDQATQALGLTGVRAPVALSGICSAGTCPFCGCHFRRPSDVLRHRCAAMQEAADSLAQIDDAIAALPEEEQAEYRRCQQSVIDARRSAERIEGQQVIG